MIGLSPEALAIILTLACGYLLIEQAIVGARAVGREAKKAGTAIVHVLKHIPHPHRHHDEEP